MRILVCGAGNIGSLYAGRLDFSGNNVSILARGERLRQIVKDGIQLSELSTRKQTRTFPRTIQRITPDEQHDLAIVAMSMDEALQLLPDLAACKGIPTVLFLGQNLRGPGRLVEALGADRVLLGFPGAAGERKGNVVQYVITSSQEQPTTIGELSGQKSDRVTEIMAALKNAGFTVAHCDNMDAWLKTHAAEICPTALALYKVGGSTEVLAKSPELLHLMIRAIKENYTVLRRSGVPIVPAHHRLFRWIPEKALAKLAGRLLQGDAAALKVSHAMGARTEIATLTAELTALASQCAVVTPAMRGLSGSPNGAVGLTTDGPHAGAPETGGRGSNVLLVG